MPSRSYLRRGLTIRQKTDDDRHHRNEGQDDDHLSGKIHSGKCGTEGRTGRNH